MKAICPHCRVPMATVGVRCTSEGCQAAGYHSIPIGWMQESEQYFSRKGRPVDALLGRMLSNEYLLAGILGEGGMGSVYLALQYPLAREVAVKTILSQSFGDESLKRFMREAKALGDLDHPNIVKLFHFGIAKLEFSLPFMVMEFIRGGRWLDRFIDRERGAEGGLSPEVVCRVFDQVLGALDAAHKVDIIHRDMKPGNILVTGTGLDARVKILDFGLVKSAAVDASSGELSRSLDALGTPMYMAPEQAEAADTRHMDGRTDLYAIGVMMFHVCTGALPFQGASPIQIMLQKSDASYDPTRLPEAAELSAAFRDFFRRALSPTIGRRPENAMKMAAEFRFLMTSERTAPVMLNTGGRQAIKLGGESAPVFQKPESSAGARPPSSGSTGAAHSHPSSSGSGASRSRVGRSWRWWFLSGVVLATAGLVFLANGLFGDAFGRRAGASASVAAVIPAPPPAPEPVVEPDPGPAAVPVVEDPAEEADVPLSEDPGAAVESEEPAEDEDEPAVEEAVQDGIVPDFQIRVQASRGGARVTVDGKGGGAGGVFTISGLRPDEVVRIRATHGDCDPAARQYKVSELVGMERLLLKMDCIRDNH